MSLVASLPWYDLPEIAPATDALWKGIARGLEGAPARLDRETDLHLQWRSPELLVSQSCGYDAILAHRKYLRVVATPRYIAPGCEGTRYRSLLVVRSDSPARDLEHLRGGRCAINTHTSHSGMNALRALVAPLSRGGRFFGAVIASGTHEESAALVARGEADLAAIDCVTHALLQRHRPRALEGTRILGETAPAPAPPFVTSRATPPRVLRQLRTALLEALADPALATARQTLLLEGAEVLPLAAYRPIAALERRALARGYREMELLRA